MRSMTAAAARPALLTVTATAPETSALPALPVRRVMASPPASARTLTAARIVRLPNRELRQGARRDRLALWTRQGCANQRPPNRPFLSHTRNMDGRCRMRLLVVVVLRWMGVRYRVRNRRGVSRRRLGMMAVARLSRKRRRKCGLGLLNKTVILVGLGQMRKAGDGLRRLQAVEHLRKERGLRSFPPLRWQFSLFVLMFCVTDDAAGLFDPIVDHRDDGVIRDTALARTIVVQHVAGPIPALLHALPRRTTSDHDAGREIGH
jgi:hypothetical protein